jgi:hypothetical protein
MSSLKNKIFHEAILLAKANPKTLRGFGPLQLVKQFPMLHYKDKNSKQIFLGKELYGLSPYFHIHMFLSDSYIPTIGLPILLQENMF